MKTVDNTTIDGPHGKLRIVLLHPPVPGPSPAIVYLHGGGWVVGGLDTHARIMRVLAERSGAVVIGVDYRLSPEHRFPVALDEACAVVEWVRQNGATQGIAVDRIALAGDSAGANLAAACAAQLAQRGDGAQAVRALGLLYGMFGLRDSQSMRTLAGPDSGLTAAGIEFYYESYLGDQVNRDDPRVNLLRAQAKFFAPSIVIAAELDPLCDDSHAFAAHLRNEGIPLELHVARGMLHGFAHMTRNVSEARSQLHRLAQFLRGWLIAA